LQIKTKIVSCHAADSKPVKQEVNGTVILPPLAFPAMAFAHKKTKPVSNLFAIVDPIRQRPGIKVIQLFISVADPPAKIS
jgi:hypothetical protein